MASALAERIRARAPEGTSPAEIRRMDLDHAVAVSVVQDAREPGAAKPGGRGAEDAGASPQAGGR